jgi:GTPase Era involved in 16S rRNA processing
MNQFFPQCSNLQQQVNSLRALVDREPSLRSQQNFNSIDASLNKALSPKFEIVFAGAFSAGKSMLINALLGRELLYSAEGHATGTECCIEYAEADKEKVVLTFLSQTEIQEQAQQLCQRLNLNTTSNILEPEVTSLLQKGCETIINKEGGESKSELAKQAKALLLLLDGYLNNKQHIHPNSYATYSMEHFNFSNLTEAAGYARRGSNSAVLKKIEYYCHHTLLKDGNILVDMPGIDAPVKKDAELTYSKIEHPDTSAVICVLKPAAAGDMTQEETDLMEKMKGNLGIRDRVFYVFNRIDETWYNTQLRQRLDSLISSEFRDSKRIYKTSGLLGFYGSKVKNTTIDDRFGLDSIFAESIKSATGEEETPQFVSEFNNYCANSGKLTRTEFKVSVNSYETPNENYYRILSESGGALIDRLIADSGIEEFHQAITHYLTEEKRPQLFATLADDLQPLCIELKKFYLQQNRDLESQPREIESMKAQELSRLNQELQQVGNEFRHHLQEEINEIVTNGDSAFEEDFQKLKTRMVSCLDELLQNFSVNVAYKRATRNHPRNSTAPFLAVLVEALYYLSNELEDVLIEASEELVDRFCQRLIDRIKKQEYYRKLYRLLGNDGNIEEELIELQKLLNHALKSEATSECDKYVRESPRFYDEGTFSIYQFRQTLQQTSQGFDAQSVVEAEPEIRQLLKLDFEPKVSTTIRRNFRQTVNQTLKTHLLHLADKQADFILQQYGRARAYLERGLQQEAEAKIALNLRLQAKNEEKVKVYNEAISGINSCLEAMQLFDRLLPKLSDDELHYSTSSIEAEFNTISENGSEVTMN